jgi:ABC-type sugar transport system ATPase subunit
MAINTEPPLLEAIQLSKRYGPIRALTDVSLVVPRGHVVGLCGHNGAGKSTLVKSLVGLVRPDQGEIIVEGKPVHFRNPQDAQASGVALVDQELSLVPVLSVADNLFLGNIDQPLLRRRRQKHAAARALLERVGLAAIEPGAPVESLLMGERQLVEIARLLGRESKVLILDEPTASLSEAETKLVFEAIQAAAAQGRSVIYVSHRLDEVLAICNTVVVLRDGHAVASQGVDQLDRGSLIELMLGADGRELQPLEAERARGNPVSIRGLVVPGRVQGFELEATGGQIIGLAGQVGSGASDILRALGGLVPDAAGEVTMRAPLRLGSVRRAVRAGVVFVSNDRQREGLFLNQSTSLNLIATRLPSLSRLGVLRPHHAREVVRRLATLVGIDERRLHSQAGQLSGGNQQKVFIGRCLERGTTNMLLLDDPTRGVDVAGRAEIHRLVRHAAAGGALVVFASTELDEILELSDLIVTIFRGNVVSRVPRERARPASVLADMTHARTDASS